MVVKAHAHPTGKVNGRRIITGKRYGCQPLERVHPTNHRRFAIDLTELESDYRNGETISTLASMYKCSAYTIYERLRDLGIVRSRAENNRLNAIRRRL